MHARTLSLIPPFATAPVLRSLLLLVLFFVEFEAVEIALRAYYDGTNKATSVWAPVSGYARWLLSFVIVFLPALLVLSSRRLKGHFQQFVSVAHGHRWGPALIVQLLAFAGFAFATYVLSVHPDALGAALPLGLLVWFGLLLATGALALRALAPWEFWSAFFRRENVTLLMAVLAAIVAQLATDHLQRWLSFLTEMTLQVSEALLRVVYSNVVVDPATHSLGTSRFQVEVTDACAGYEGIALISVFLALYLWLFRRDFRFPRVLLMFPLGILVIWSFNALRIATLIGIGDAFSEEVAIAGFHSNAGWIAFIVVSLGLLALMHKVPFFAAAGKQAVAPAAKTASVRAADALLVPLVVMLAFTLLSGAFTAGFDWLYPLKVIGTGIALWFFWRVYDFSSYSASLIPVAAGAAVFGLWMVLVPLPAERTAEMAAALAGAPAWLVAAWFLFRCLGSAVVVPLAEELAFRGYLLRRLSGDDAALAGGVRFTWLSFLLSSVLFGLFHGAWLAGTIAGLAYALVRYYRGALGDAVVAHMTTNLMLSGYVLMTGQWGYW